MNSSEYDNLILSILPEDRELNHSEKELIENKLFNFKETPKVGRRIVRSTDGWYTRLILNRLRGVPIIQQIADLGIDVLIVRQNFFVMSEFGPNLTFTTNSLDSQIIDLTASILEERLNPLCGQGLGSITDDERQQLTSIQITEAGLFPTTLWQLAYIIQVNAYHIGTTFEEIGQFLQERVPTDNNHFPNWANTNLELLYTSLVRSSGEGFGIADLFHNGMVPVFVIKNKNGTLALNTNLSERFRSCKVGRCPVSGGGKNSINEVFRKFMEIRSLTKDHLNSLIKFEG